MAREAILKMMCPFEPPAKREAIKINPLQMMIRIGRQEKKA